MTTSEIKYVYKCPGNKIDSTEEDMQVSKHLNIGDHLHAYGAVYTVVRKRLDRESNSVYVELKIE
ncbi:hypothetical protein IFT62_14180 [Pseudomonas lutea]|uniref:Uncharacterized protein n=1 Tax=Pseudomonas lutea TaxID=243924 RepID=A0ABR9A8D0_9PSED|nr:hypothetical protein [Pseudomonas lutea]MBD8122368.1 hypothetical protein [Pseudomonas lutea]